MERIELFGDGERGRSDGEPRLVPRRLVGPTYDGVERRGGRECLCSPTTHRRRSISRSNAVRPVAAGGWRVEDRRGAPRLVLPKHAHPTRHGPWLPTTGSRRAAERSNTQALVRWPVRNHRRAQRLLDCAVLGPAREEHCLLLMLL